MDYLSRLLTTALAPTFRIFDVAGFFIVPLLRFFGGDKMTDDMALTLAIWAALGLVLARILASPYLVWKEDQAKIASLMTDLERPERERDLLRIKKKDEECSAMWQRSTALKTQVDRLCHQYNSVESGDDRHRILEATFSCRQNFENQIAYFIADPEIHAKANKVLSAVNVVIFKATNPSENPFESMEDLTLALRELKAELDK